MIAEESLQKRFIYFPAYRNINVKSDILQYNTFFIADITDVCNKYNL